MPEYLAPGVYVEEIEIGTKPIEGVSTSTAGFVGETERGPTSPKLITGSEEFRRAYGAFSWGLGQNSRSSSYLPHAIEGFFANGGKRCFVARVVGDASIAARLEVSERSSLGEELTSEIGDTGETGPAPPPKHESPENPNPIAFTIRAIGPGSWGNRVAIKISPGSLSDLKSGLFKMQVFYWNQLPPEPLVDPTDAENIGHADRREPTLSEDYDNLSFDPVSSDFYLKVLNGRSNLIRIDEGSETVTVFDPTSRPMMRMSGGNDGERVTLRDYQGEADGNQRTGLAALGDIDEISILCVPDENDHEGLSTAIVDHAELAGDRFAVLQAPQDGGPVNQLRPPVDSKYSAFYYPWLRVVDAATGVPRLIPPGGHVAGVYARTDAERGVHKAPANATIRGALELQFAISKAEQEILNPRGVNCLREFRGRGVRVWGARTTSSDPLWKYVNVRRLLLFIEESIEQAAQWVVFEPNDHRLWARVRQTVSDFLNRIWRDGALMGSTPDEAFFVKCDETTMTPADIETGRLIVMIGVAPVRPAEFVIFRLAQWRGGSAVIE